MAPRRLERQGFSGASLNAFRRVKEMAREGSGSPEEGEGLLGALVPPLPPALAFLALPLAIPWTSRKFQKLA